MERNTRIAERNEERTETRRNLPSKRAIFRGGKERNPRRKEEVRRIGRKARQKKLYTKNRRKSKKNGNQQGTKEEKEEKEEWRSLSEVSPPPLHLHTHLNVQDIGVV